MKYILIAIFLSTTALATEIEFPDHCGSAQARRASTRNQISQVTREIVRLHVGVSEEYFSSIATSGPSHCEDDGLDEYTRLQRNRDYLEKQLETIETEIRRYCPDSRPE